MTRQDMPAVHTFVPEGGISGTTAIQIQHAAAAATSKTSCYKGVRLPSATHHNSWLWHSVAHVCWLAQQQGLVCAPSPITYANHSTTHHLPTTLTPSPPPTVSAHTTQSPHEPLHCPHASPTLQPHSLLMPSQSRTSMQAHIRAAVHSPSADPLASGPVSTAACWLTAGAHGPCSAHCPS